MAPKNIAGQVREYIASVFDESVYELVDVEFVKEGPNWYLRIFADKPGGIAIDDCEFLSRKISAILDDRDPIEQNYILEVSSPGIDRPLKNESDYKKFAGEIVDIKLYKAVEKEKQFQGELLGLENGVVSIKNDKGSILTFDLKDIAMCRLAVIF